MQRSQKYTLASSLLWTGVSFMLPLYVGVPFIVAGLAVLWWAMKPSQVERLIARLPRPLSMAGTYIILCIHKKLDDVGVVNKQITSNTYDEKENAHQFHQIISAQSLCVQGPLLPGNMFTVKYEEEYTNDASWQNNEKLFIESAGLYRFDLIMDIDSLDVNADLYQVRLNTSNAIFRIPFSPNNLSNKLPLSLSFDAEMDSGDTATIEIIQHGGRPISMVKSGALLRIYRTK